MEDMVKTLIGSMHLQIISLQHDLKQARQRIMELEVAAVQKEKETLSPEDVG